MSNRHAAGARALGGGLAANRRGRFGDEALRAHARCELMADANHAINDGGTAGLMVVSTAVTLFPCCPDIVPLTATSVTLPGGSGYRFAHLEG